MHAGIVTLCTPPITNDINNTTAKIIYIRSSFRFVYSLFIKYCMSVRWVVAASGVKKWAFKRIQLNEKLVSLMFMSGKNETIHERAQPISMWLHLGFTSFHFISFCLFIFHCVESLRVPLYTSTLSLLSFPLFFLLFRIENCLCIQSWWMMAMKCESVACACVFKWHLEINSRLCDDLAAFAPTDHKDQSWYSIYLFSIEEKPYIKHVWMYH